MKTIIGTLLALGLLSTSASAWTCPPGSGKSFQKPTSSRVATKAQAAQAAPAAPADQTPAPAPEPQK